MADRLNARPAELRDAAAIAEIYNQGIEDRVATFETERRTPEAIEGQLAARAGKYPAVVVDDGEHVIGFAWSSEYRPRDAYAGVAEISIYVARESRGRGVGRLSLGALITEAEQRRFWKLVRASSRRISRAAAFVQRWVSVRSACIAGMGSSTDVGWTA